MKEKIIQILVTPNDKTYQGVLYGLSNTGNLYQASSDKWEYAGLPPLTKKLTKKLTKE